jgi:DNA-binding CsgD family transcriptional regulator
MVDKGRQWGISMLDLSREAHITERQQDCLTLVSQGYTSKEIGRQLGLSPSTVDNHILAAMQALGESSRAAAARKFMALTNRQKMPSESHSLAEPAKTASIHPNAEANAWAHLGKLAFALPPIGGHRNDLDWVERTFRIFQVAVLSLGIFLSLAVIIAGAFSIFS